MSLPPPTLESWLKMKNLVFRTPQKMLRFPYFRGEGGGQE